MTTKIPVTIVGGYLGAGKTTLVNHLLRNAGGLRLAVLVNDFGALPIDADLIEAQGEDLISIAGGCICCSFGSDLVGALMAMADRATVPDHVLIETSGVALPGSVARSVALLPACSIDGVLVLADAETVQTRARDKYMGDTITRQLAEADLVIATKPDLAGPEKMAALSSWMEAAAPRARLIEAVRGRVPVELAFGAQRLRPDVAGGLFSCGPIRAAEDASSRYESAAFTAIPAMDVEGLARILADPGTGLLRAKGVLRDLDGSLKVLHVVGPRFEVAALAGASATGMVCISQKGRMNRTAIERAITANS